MAQPPAGYVFSPPVSHHPKAPPESPRALLVMGASGTRVIALPERGELSIGRAEACDVRVDDEKVSRRHAVLRVGDVVELVDIGSRNGTVVGSHKLAPRETVTLQLSDVVTLGGTVLRLQRTAPTTIRVWSAAEYEALFNEERERADRTGRSVRAPQPPRPPGAARLGR